MNNRNGTYDLAELNGVLLKEKVSGSRLRLYKSRGDIVGKGLSVPKPAAFKKRQEEGG